MTPSRGVHTQVVESVRKLSLSSLMVFILPGTAVQIVLAELIGGSSNGRPEPLGSQLE